MPRFHETRLTLSLVDLVGYARAIRNLDAVQVATFLDDFYVHAHGIITSAGGQVIKFIGDSVLSVFPPDQTIQALDATLEIQSTLRTVTEQHGLSLDAGANVHTATVVQGELGPESCRFPDVIGAGVNHLFLMGRGPGCRISEPVYRQLPNDRRAAWNKQKPPATYHLA